MRIKTFVILLIGLLAWSCQDEITVHIEKEPGTLVGYVLPAGINAVVELHQGKLVVKTDVDADGYFTFTDMAPGGYRLFCNALGYSQYERRVTISDGEVIDLGEIYLINMPYPLYYISPADGAVNVANSNHGLVVKLQFRESMDFASINSAVSIYPIVADFEIRDHYSSGRYRDKYPNGRYFECSGVFLFDTQYTINIDTSALTITGERIDGEYYFSFSTEEFLVGFNFYPYTYYGDNYSRLYFNTQIYPISVLDYLVINPEIPYQLDNYYLIDNYIRITPQISWIPDTTITFTITQGLPDIFGDSLAYDTSFSITTPPLTVRETDPYPGMHFVPVESHIIIKMNNVLDESTIESAIAISPETEFTLSTDRYRGTTEFIIDPDSLLTGETTYTVTLNTSLRDYYGGPFKQPYTLSFTTE